MTKIGIQTWGSNGDIRPLMALAEGLTRQDHQVTLTVSSIDNRNYQSQSQQLHLSYRHIPEHFDFDMPAFAQKTFRMNTIQWLNALLEAVYFPYQLEIYEAARDLCAENDLVIGHHFLSPLKLAALQQDIPYVSITLCHALLACSSQPPFHFPNLGTSLNPILWRLVEQLFDLAMKKQLGRLWRSQGGPEINHVYTGLLSSDLLNLVAVDPVFCPEQEDWPDRHRICGFFDFSDSAEIWSLPESLTRFLEQGEKPIYMTFGSLQQAVSEWSMDLFMEACAIAGCRAIIQSSSSRFPPDTQQDRLYFIGKHPHQPVFKHCAAVVHHGGAGTSHASAQSGCPSIVVPFMDEQLFWGVQLQRQMMAPAPVPAKKVTAKRLAAKIKQTLDNVQYLEQARSQCSKMHSINGVEQAINTLKYYALIS